MFSGIVEAQSHIIKQTKSDQALRIVVERPHFFDDIQIGDSICTNGVCLTIEKFDFSTIQFCLGSETLNLLKTSLQSWFEYPLNLERSVRLGDRIHGHLVSGHVDCATEVMESFADGECWQMRIKLPNLLKNFVWKKGSITLNGVSLTVNEIQKTSSLQFDLSDQWFEVCLIPETMQKTNLIQFKKGSFIHLEVDYLAKSFLSRYEGLSVKDLLS